MVKMMPTIMEIMVKMMMKDDEDDYVIITPMITKMMVNIFDNDSSSIFTNTK